MQPTDDWDRLATEWRRGGPAASTPSLESLAARDGRERRRAGWIRLAGAALSAIILVEGIGILRVHPDLLGAILVIPGWIASGFLWWGATLAATRDEPRDESALSFLERAAIRLERQLRATEALLALMATQALLLVLWATGRFVEPRDPAGPSDLVGWGVAGCAAILLVIWSAWRRRVLRRERDELARLRADLEGAG